MELKELTSLASVEPHLKVTSKKQALQALAERAQKVTGLEARRVFETLLERERLGSTGAGHGAAIPHGKFEGLEKLHVLFAKLDNPIDFDSIDGQPVSILVTLLAPEGAGADHLKALARISRMLRDGAFVDTLMGCDSAEAMLAHILETDAAQ